MAINFELGVKLDHCGIKLCRVFICGALFLACAFSINGQSYEPAHPITCEEAVYHFSDALLQQSKRKNKDSTMIMILRPGANESSKINAARLRSIKTFVANRKPDFIPLYGTAEPLEKNGVIEIYVDGVRIYRLPVERNKDIDFTICTF
jgi:hypothetical protein